MLNIIVAPASVDATAIKYTKQIVKFLKAEKQEFSVYFSETLEEIANNVNELLSFAETDFVVVGNEIVLHEFLNSAKDISKIRLGIIPTSNQDDFASFIGLNSNPILAMKEILEKNIQLIDFMLVNDKKVLNSVEIGAGVEAEEIFENFKIKNSITRTFANVKYGKKFEGLELEMTTKNNKARKENVYELVVANGGISKGKKVSPLSNVKDGLFNLNYSSCETKSARIRFTKSIANGKHIYDEKTKQFWLDNIKIVDHNKKIKCLLDGKLYTFDALEINLIEGGLKIFKSKD